MKTMDVEMQTMVQDAIQFFGSSFCCASAAMEMAVVSAAITAVF